jgi:hypothetical protein
MTPKKPAYNDTNVPVEKSQQELRELLRKFGAMQFSFGEGRDWAGLEFVHDEQLVRVRCPLRQPDDRQISSYNKAAHTPTAESVMRLLDKEAMRVWRVLVWTVKARLVAVEEGLETFEQSFLSHLVDPSSDKTLWQAMREPIESGMLKLGGPGLRALGRGDG